MASITDHLNNTTTYTYDLTGRRLTITDPRGFTTRYTYDFLSRLLSVAQPGGHAVQFEYDANSNLTKVIDPRGGQIVYTYNTMDWLETRTDQLLRIERYTYDLAGNVSQFQDRKNQFTTWAAYDARNRPTTVTYQDASTMTYNYDAAGRLWQLTDSLAGTITRTFDALDRLTTETTPQGSITYQPDDADRRISMLVAGQPDVTYLWDNANRLQSITRQQAPPLVASYFYDDANRRTQLTLPNGVAIGYGYDGANRLTGLTYSGLQGGPQTLTYTYDPAGNRVRTGGSWARTLLPDPISSASYDAANRQLTLGGKTMTYDLNGNLATLTESRQTTTYTWDARDRLVGLTGPGLTTSFAYDATSRRTSKTITGFSRTFMYDGVDIIKETAAGATVNYLRGLGIDEHLAQIEDSGGTFCYAPDPLGSTVALTDSNAATSTEYTYEPFGRTVATGAASQNAFKFTGREDDGTGLYYYRARFYDSRLGRFIREDPIELSGGGPHFYAYVGNNPVNAVDPYGLYLPWHCPLCRYYGEKCVKEGRECAGKSDQPKKQSLCLLEPGYVATVGGECGVPAAAQRDPNRDKLIPPEFKEFDWVTNYECFEKNKNCQKMWEYCTKCGIPAPIPRTGPGSR